MSLFVGHSGSEKGKAQQWMSDYAALFSRFYGQDSVMERLVATHGGSGAGRKGGGVSGNSSTGRSPIRCGLSECTEKISF